MNDTLNNLLNNLNFGEKAEFENMAVFPIINGQETKLDYMTMREAFANHLLIIEEVSSGGSVPELRAVNKSDNAVLLVDGEEIIGAKQNRIMNTTVLIPENSKIIINVSCTEQGRWSYDTRHFSDSNVVAAKDIRAKKMASVNHNLYSTGNYRSDQGEVWDEIYKRQERANVRSSTGAMKDVYEAKKHELNNYLGQFTAGENQVGLLVFIDGRPAGMDIVSLSKAYHQYHEKIVQSYAMEASLSRRPVAGAVTDEKAQAFITQAGNCNETRYDSIGHGYDYRYTGTGIVGSSLIYDNTAIHTAFFSMGGTIDEKMSGFRKRRRYRV